MLLDLALRPALHGASGFWDEVISWGMIVVIVVLIGFLVYQGRQKSDDEGDAEDVDMDM